MEEIVPVNTRELEASSHWIALDAGDQVEVARSRFLQAGSNLGKRHADLIALPEAELMDVEFGCVRYDLRVDLPSRERLPVRLLLFPF